jgi:hypothetical protein
MIGLVSLLAAPIPVYLASTRTASAGGAAPAAAWTLKWSPRANVDGLKAFEGVEEDRGGVHKAVKHIYVQGDAYRFDMHTGDRDTPSDRQRSEVKGMRAGGANLDLFRGTTWRFNYSMYIPASLKATTSFTHIMQLKKPGPGTGPIMTMSLRRKGNTPTIELKSNLGNVLVGSVPLTGLQDTWLDTSVEVTTNDAPNGRLRWTLNHGPKKLIDAEKAGLDMWLGERTRPKWGIYRSLGDKSAIQNTYLLLKDMKAYQRTGAASTDGPAPTPTATSPAPKPTVSPTPTPTVSPTQPSAGGLTPDQRRRADQILSTFENSTTTIQYGYAENLGDGRGVTAGRAGFCTGTGDAVLVVERYTKAKPGNVLAKFLPELRKLAKSGSAKTSGLPEAAYVKAWRQAAADGAFRQAQDQITDELYFNPAMRYADKAGVKTALARAQLYDAIVQHGGGTDPDSLGALLKRTNAAAGGTPATGVNERTWLARFFEVRIADLRNPANDETQEEWAGSVDRVKSMQRIAATGNYDLRGPISFSVYGDSFRID